MPASALPLEPRNAFQQIFGSQRFSMLYQAVGSFNPRLFFERSMIRKLMPTNRQVGGTGRSS